MRNSFDLSVFNKQSAKGILVIYFKNLYKLVKIVLLAFLPIIITSQSSQKKIALLIIGGVSMFIFLLVRSILVYANYKFKITDTDFILKHGVLRKKLISIPFERIQNINFKQNLIQQLINVTQVDVETAGAKSIEISIKALRRDEAEKIKATVFKNKQVEKTNDEEVVKQKPILKIALVDLLKESITENHLKSFAIFLAFLSTMYQQIKDVFKDFDFKDSTGIDVEETSNSMEGMVSLIILALVISVVISFFRIVFTHFDLTLYYKNQVLEIVQGLFEKKHQILKKEKVQSIVITTNPFKKIIGISSVYFKQVANTKKSGKKVLPTRVIGCKSKHIETIIQFLYNNFDFTAIKKSIPNKYYIVQMTIKNLVFIVILNTFIFFFENYHLLYLNLALIPFSALLIYMKYQKSYFKFNEELIIIGSGQIGTDITYFPYYKLQSIELIQSIFQKKRNVYDLILHNATDKILLPCVNDLEALQLYNHFLFQTEKSTKKWM